ncbi:MAG: hypothetical protein AVDCRST_MAG25-1527, partial [uncultured Rubrobacteraceae bacterium]
ARAANVRDLDFASDLPLRFCVRRPREGRVRTRRREGPAPHRG